MAISDWNVVVTVTQHGFKRACELLEPYGAVSRTDYFNVLVMRVEDGRRLLEALHRDPGIREAVPEVISRVVPADETFVFQSPEEFERHARAIAGRWAPRLAGRRFHVRMHRRGFKGRLSSQEEERFLDHYLVGEVSRGGGECAVDFDDPDIVIALETVGQRAGLSLWTREERARYPLLRLD